MTISTLLDLHHRIVNQIAEAIIYADTKGIIREWNGAAGHTLIQPFPQVMEPIRTELRRPQPPDRRSIAFHKRAFSNHVPTSGYTIPFVLKESGSAIFDAVH
ncbi:hypothetical protein [Paludibacterium denitrificans]|uniref:hypothetical protein n=1 Tax=Paludibacterium denitrificans TaxID=2675226 RepID=UPI001E327A08|nr:hypothetical protein [Paludibacterium denitrificans]